MTVDDDTGAHWAAGVPRRVRAVHRPATPPGAGRGRADRHRVRVPAPRPDQPPGRSPGGGVLARGLGARRPPLDAPGRPVHDDAGPPPADRRDGRRRGVRQPRVQRPRRDGGAGREPPPRRPDHREGRSRGQRLRPGPGVLRRLAETTSSRGVPHRPRSPPDGTHRHVVRGADAVRRARRPGPGQPATAGGGCRVVGGRRPHGHGGDERVRRADRGGAYGGARHNLERRAVGVPIAVGARRPAPGWLRRWRRDAAAGASAAMVSAPPLLGTRPPPRRSTPGSPRAASFPCSSRTSRRRPRHAAVQRAGRPASSAASARTVKLEDPPTPPKIRPRCSRSAPGSTCSGGWARSRPSASSGPGRAGR